ncbi:MAG: hypothetical protein ACXU7H_13225 [Burkholderiaceae bacterium]
MTAIENHLRRKFELDLPVRIKRTEEMSYLRIIGAHYFAAASSQCLELYRDGYMLGCIMCSQALLEAILKFVAQRNGMEYKKEVEELIKDLEARNVLEGDALSGAKTAWHHRNDFHHLNPAVSVIDLEAKAKECVEAVSALEQKIFGTSIINGTLAPHNPIYWDVQSDNTVPVFLRQLDV